MSHSHYPPARARRYQKVRSNPSALPVSRPATTAPSHAIALNPPDRAQPLSVADLPAQWRYEAQALRRTGQSYVADTVEALSAWLEAALCDPTSRPQSVPWPQFLTVAEAAELARMSPSWVYAQASKAPREWVERRGSQIRIEAAGFRRWLIEHDEQAAA